MRLYSAVEGCLSKGVTMGRHVSLHTATFCLLLACSNVASGNSSGPINGVTGAPGEGTCANCHGNLNVGSGTLGLTAPAGYVAGAVYDLGISLAQNGQQRWGFEITALDGNNQRAGTFIITQPTRTQLSTDGITGRQYAKHTLAGTDLGIPNVAPGWTVRWQAPTPAVGDVIFYLAGNAANGNGLTTGDFIYTTSRTSADLTTAVPESGLLRLAQNHPNPFNPATAIDFSLPAAGPARLRILDLAGRVVRTLLDGPQAAGAHSVLWNGEDDAGHAVASGRYLYVLEGGGQRSLRTMTLVR